MTNHAASHDGSSSYTDQRLPQGEHTESSRYGSDESEEDSNNTFKIQRMSLGPRGADLLRKRFGQIKEEVQAEKPPETNSRTWWIKIG